jgi:hypothetical protein
MSLIILPSRGCKEGQRCVECGGLTQRRPRFSKAIEFGPERRVPLGTPLWVEPLFRCPSRLSPEPFSRLQLSKLGTDNKSVPDSPFLLQARVGVNNNLRRVNKLPCKKSSGLS